MKPYEQTLKRRLATLSLAALSMLALPGIADAHGRGRVVVYGPRAFFGFGFYPGFYGFYPGPYGYWGAPPRGGMDLNFVRAMGIGALELHVKPGKAEVWVDGQFAGKASDFDGWPSYLWMKKGTHKITVYQGGYETFNEKYDVAPGTVFEVHLKLNKGQSTPPKAVTPARPVV